MAIDPRDVGELQKALNDAAGKASALWTTFVTFALYLAIAFGSVTHRDLFLENPVKLPILNVDLPLTAFFAVAPAVFVIFHFYVYLQLIGLARKARDYNALLRSEIRIDSDRQIVRQRVDAFPLAQFLAGPREQRLSLTGFSLRFIAWVTLVAAPVLVLILAQLTFLPYHLAWVTWVERMAILLDLALIWYFWDRVRAGDGPIIGGVPVQVWRGTGLTATAAIGWFSVFVAYFPGECVELWGLDQFPAEFSRPQGPWLPLNYAIFGGRIDTVRGQPRGLLSNRLVLMGQSFIDTDRLAKVTVSRSFRGRDLRRAVLSYSDLRKADFTGADLSEAELDGADLSAASLTCSPRKPGRSGLLICTDLRSAHLQGATLAKANLGGAQMQGSQLGFAHIEGADLRSAHLEGSNVAFAHLEGADLRGAIFDGATLVGARLALATLEEAGLRGASLSEVSAPGTNFDKAHLDGASAGSADFVGASFAGAELRGINLRRANLTLAHFYKAKLEGAMFGELLHGTSFQEAKLWRATSQRGSFSLVDCRDTWLVSEPLPKWEWTNLLQSINRIGDADVSDQALRRITRADPGETTDTSGEVKPDMPDFVADSACEKFDPDRDDAGLGQIALRTACGDEGQSDESSTLPPEAGTPVAARLLRDFLASGRNLHTRFEQRPLLMRSFVEAYFAAAGCRESRDRLPPDFLRQVRAKAAGLGYNVPPP